MICVVVEHTEATPPTKRETNEKGFCSQRCHSLLNAWIAFHLKLVSFGETIYLSQAEFYLSGFVCLGGNLPCLRKVKLHDHGFCFVKHGLCPSLVFSCVCVRFHDFCVFGAISLK